MVSPIKPDGSEQSIVVVRVLTAPFSLHLTSVTVLPEQAGSPTTRIKCRAKELCRG